MNNKINKSLLIVIVAALCLIISGCLGGGTVSDLPESDLPDCETLYGVTGYWNNCQGTYTCSNGTKYVGEYKDNMFHGQGTFTYPDGHQYVGEWEDGMTHGQGTLTYANGDQLEGIWREGEFLYENKGK